MAKKKEAETPEAETPEKKEKKKASVISVLDKDKKVVRQYTRELHGDRVEEYAEEYAKKIGGGTRVEE